MTLLRELAEDYRIAREQRERADKRARMDAGIRKLLADCNGDKAYRDVAWELEEALEVMPTEEDVLT